MKILIMLEDNNGKIHRMGLESIVAAQKMASELNGELGAVVMGKNADALADEAASYKLDEVIKVKDSLLDNYSADGYALPFSTFTATLSTRNGCINFALTFGA